MPVLRVSSVYGQATVEIEVTSGIKFFVSHMDFETKDDNPSKRDGYKAIKFADEYVTNLRIHLESDHTTRTYVVECRFSGLSGQILYLNFESRDRRLAHDLIVKVTTTTERGEHDERMLSVSMQDDKPTAFAVPTKRKASLLSFTDQGPPAAAGSDGKENGRGHGQAARKASKG